VSEEAVKAISVVVGILAGIPLGFYLAMLLVFKDWNPKRGIERWIHEVVREAIEKVNRDLK